MPYSKSFKSYPLIMFIQGKIQEALGLDAYVNMSFEVSMNYFYMDISKYTAYYQLGNPLGFQVHTDMLVKSSPMFLSLHSAFSPQPSD